MPLSWLGKLSRVYKQREIRSGFCVERIPSVQSREHTGGGKKWVRADDLRLVQLLERMVVSEIRVATESRLERDLEWNSTWWPTGYMVWLLGFSAGQNVSKLGLCRPDLFILQRNLSFSEPQNFYSITIYGARYASGCWWHRSGPVRLLWI